MSADVSKSLEGQLSLASKQVNLVLAIDAACDNAVDDREAPKAAVTLITQALKAEAGLLSWFDPDSHHVNLAARLCGAAEGLQILISAATYELVCNQIEAEPVAALHLKGIAEAVAAYQALRLK